jgi:hypothetical protein
MYDPTMKKYYDKTPEKKIVDRLEKLDQLDPPQFEPAEHWPEYPDGDNIPVATVYSPETIPVPQGWKYNEDQILHEVEDHIKNTQSAYYSDGTFEAFDAWISLGNATSSFRDNAIKYLWRYGKKKGNNKKDLLKAMHYITMMIHTDYYKGKK